MRIDVLSIFPDYLAPLGLSLVGKAIETRLVDLRVHDLRDWTTDRHRSVDDTPYGGGAGMVMKPEPWGRALDDLVPPDATPRPRLILLTPSGRVFDQRLATELTAESHLVLACGRYEGIDARVGEYARGRMAVDEVSIGDYVLNGGEAAALVVVESVVRLLPGVIGNPASLAEESHSAAQDGLLEYPAYTKPPSWRGLDVPEVLFSGHHAQVAAWRRQQAIGRTRAVRPELLPEAEREWQLLEATPDDAGELLTLQRAAFVQEAYANASLDLPPLRQTLPELRESLGHGTTVVLRRRGRLVGSVHGEKAPGDSFYIGRLMVAPDLQGQGLGSRLLSEIEARAPAGTRRLRLVTGAASASSIAFYSRRGYAVTGRGRGETSVDIVVMRKAVPVPA